MHLTHFQTTKRKYEKIYSDEACGHSSLSWYVVKLISIVLFFTRSIQILVSSQSLVNHVVHKLKPKYPNNKCRAARNKTSEWTSNKAVGESSVGQQATIRAYGIICFGRQSAPDILHSNGKRSQKTKGMNYLWHTVRLAILFVCDEIHEIQWLKMPSHKTFAMCILVWTPVANVLRLIFRAFLPTP